MNFSSRCHYLIQVNILRLILNCFNYYWVQSNFNFSKRIKRRKIEVDIVEIICKGFVFYTCTLRGKITGRKANSIFLDKDWHWDPEFVQHKKFVTVISVAWVVNKWKKLWNYVLISSLWNFYCELFIIFLKF